ncbi:anaerobic magnesium-protoporphyrin IX monomethyl ester cyclase [Anaerolineae bacterium]|nr:anaerobic magnesium-protoporphyrin IX monomethyl ester cyclase [Anaerolineae bacterium]
MRVLLINPRFQLPIDTRTTPHLGLAYLAAVSEQHGDEVRVFDMDVEDVKLTDFVREYQPDIVGITSNTPQVKQGWYAAREIKSVADIPIVQGGPHVSALPEESASRPEIDIVARGEGEDTWINLCEVVERTKSSDPKFQARDLLDPANKLLDGVLGITYQALDGKVKHTHERPAIADLDALPFPAYHFFKMERYTSLQPAMDAIDMGKSFSMMTSRGCPYRCTFCSQSVMAEKWRARSPESVVKEWRHLVHDLGAQEIGILDDSANINRKRLHDLCTRLIEEKLNHVPWILINGIRANLADEELLKHMKDAGLLRLAFGVETGDEDILESIDKRVTHDQIRAAFKNAKKVGLETVGFFIIGLPGDNEETMEKTIKFACELDPLVANFSMMTPYPGTKVWEQVHRNGGRMLVKDWQDYVFFEGKARFEMGETTAEAQERKWKEAYRRFYLRPHRIAMTLMRKSTWQHFPRTLRMALKIVLPKKTKDDVKTKLDEARAPAN